MEHDKELVQVLNGIRTELQLLNKTLSGLAAQQNRPAARTSAAESPAAYGAPRRGGSPAAGGRTGGYKRKSDDGYKRKPDGGEPVGYGAEMATRFPKKRSAPKAKSPSPGGKPKKGSGYPKKAK